MSINQLDRKVLLDGEQIAQIAHIIHIMVKDYYRIEENDIDAVSGIEAQLAIFLHQQNFMIHEEEPLTRNMKMSDSDFQKNIEILKKIKKQIDLKMKNKYDFSILNHIANTTKTGEKMSVTREQPEERKSEVGEQLGRLEKTILYQQEIINTFLDRIDLVLSNKGTFASDKSANADEIKAPLAIAIHKLTLGVETNTYRLLNALNNLEL